MGMLDLFSRKKNILADTAFDEASYVFLDTELTGLDEEHDAIISIGAVRMKGRRINLGDSFYRFSRPEGSFNHKSVVIHNIMPSEVESEPEIAVVFNEFRKFCSKDIIAGYCIAIDLHFINRESRRISGVCLDNPIIDIFAIYEWLRRNSHEAGRYFPVIREHGLYAMAEHFRIPVSAVHNALVDAYLSAQVFQRLLVLVQKTGIQNIGELIRIGDPFKGGDIFKTASETISL